MLDLLIKGGTIVDGGGNPGFYGAIGVSGDTVSVLRGDVSAIEASRVIDAAGKIVCPGFIDVHAHSALMIFADPRHEPKVHQGITTELLGIDGNSYAPFRSEDDLMRMIRINSGLEGDPELPGTWSSVTEYLDMYDGKVAVNIAYIVGNSPIRVGAMGWGDRQPTGQELETMKSLLRESMEEGAYGISTGLDYPPGSYADTDELVEVSAEAARLGGIYHTHVRYKLGDQYMDPFLEAIEIGRRSGVPVHITHFGAAANHGDGGRKLLELVEDSRDSGLDVTFDCFPYPQAGTRLNYFLPQWTHDGGPERVMEVMRDPEARERLRHEMTPGFAGTWSRLWLTYFKQPHNQQYEGKSVAEIADMMGKHPVDAMCDLMLEEDMQTSWVSEGGDAESLPDFVCHPLQMVGSDAILLGDFPNSMCYGTFPIILGKFVRDEGKMSLPEAIRKMTSYPAQRLGIPDRGLLKDGMKADVVVFDFENIRAHSVRWDPKQYSDGVEYVIVNGTVVMDQGRHTGALPGRALRRGR